MKNLVYIPAFYFSACHFYLDFAGCKKKLKYYNPTHRPHL